MRVQECKLACTIGETQWWAQPLCSSIFYWAKLFNSLNFFPEPQKVWRDVTYWVVHMNEMRSCIPQKDVYDPTESSWEESVPRCMHVERVRSQFVVISPESRSIGRKSRDHCCNFIDTIVWQNRIWRPFKHCFSMCVHMYICNTYIDKEVHVWICTVLSPIYTLYVFCITVHKLSLLY